MDAAPALPVKLALVGVLGATAAAVPAWRCGLLLLAGWLAVALTVAGTLRHRPAAPFGWWALAGALTLWATANSLLAVAGRETRAGTWCILGALAVGLAALPSLSGGAPERARLDGGEHHRPGSRTDLLILGVATALVGLDLGAIALAEGSVADRLADLFPVSSVVIVAAVFRMAATRPVITPSVALGTVGVVGTAVLDLVGALSGWKLPAPGSPYQVLALAGMLFLALAADHPTMNREVERHHPDRTRRPSAQLLALVPVCLLPPGLWALVQFGNQAGLPPWAFMAASVLISTLLLLRAVLALRAGEWLADHDALTDLLNRRGLDRELQARTAELATRPLNLCLVDLDDFKEINDTCGHDCGDRLLAEVAARIVTATDGRATVGRLGGDEFVVLVPGSEDAGAELLTALDRPFRIEDRQVTLGASVGVVRVTHGRRLSELLAEADIAMYAAKNAGKGNAVVYRDDLREEVLGRLRMLRELRDLVDGAREEHVGRLVVRYQPIVELDSGAVTGCEALVRWMHPQRGLVPPDTFIAAAEQGGFIARLDSLVLDLALAQLSAWDGKGMDPVTMSVNLGLGSMLDPELVARVTASVARHGVDSRRLQLEITEHSELPEEEGSSHALRSLTRSGIRLSLDDFGTGYTSLNYLRRYPITQLKLDRSIVATEAASPRSPLIEGIVGLAAGLRMDVLAEGIETEAQRGRLASLGIRLGQGYLFARPLEAADFADVVRHRAEPAAAPRA